MSIDEALGLHLHYNTRGYFRRVGVATWDDFCALSDELRLKAPGWGRAKEEQFQRVRAATLTDSCR